MAHDPAAEVNGGSRSAQASADYRGIRVLNHPRPLAFYVSALLAHGLQLVHFAEPAPIEGAPAAKAEKYRRVPWFVVMEWARPA